jgi:hypothetical protein
MIIKTNTKKRYLASFFWHRWFAWHPVILDDEIAWLESVWRVRRSSWYDSCWDYSTDKIKPQDKAE